MLADMAGMNFLPLSPPHVHENAQVLPPPVVSHSTRRLPSAVGLTFYRAMDVSKTGFELPPGNYLRPALAPGPGAYRGDCRRRQA